MNRQRIVVALSIAAILALTIVASKVFAGRTPAAGSEAALTAKDVGAKLFPDIMVVLKEPASAEPIAVAF